MEPLPQRLDTLFEVRLKLGDRFAINPACTFAIELLPGLPEEGWRQNVRQGREASFRVLFRFRGDLL
jgi:hypothetical protein